MDYQEVIDTCKDDKELDALLDTARSILDISPNSPEMITFEIGFVRGWKAAYTFGNHCSMCRDSGNLDD